MTVKSRVLGVALLYSMSLQAATGEVTQNPLRNVYFGETHMHTAYSLDAYLGGTRQTPADAYRAAKGEAVIVNGQPHRMHRNILFRDSTVPELPMSAYDLGREEQVWAWQPPRTATR